MDKLVQFLVRFAGLIITLLVTGFVVMLLWNWVIPSLFAIREISYLEGVGIYGLIATISKGIKLEMALTEAKSE